MPSSSPVSMSLDEKGDMSIEKSSSNSSKSKNTKKNNGHHVDDMEMNRVNLFLHAENVRIFASAQDDCCLPVTLVTGFLGAGKTTLLHHILSRQKGYYASSNLRIAAAINDFAELNIDENLIRNQGTASRVVELSNGCVCCHLLDDLQEAVWQMLQSSGTDDDDVDAVNYLLIETSGVSDPLRIIRTLDAKFGKCFRARLDSVVTVVDADQMLPYCYCCSTTGTSVDDDDNDSAAPDMKKKKSISSNMMMSRAAMAQLECADVVIVNKMDLLQDPVQHGQALERLIRSINPHARIHQTRHCQVPLSAILDVVPIPTIPSSSSSSGSTPITHEQSNVPIYISATGGALRCASSLDAATKKSNHATIATATATSHLKTDDFLSLSVTVSNGPLSLHKFCRFVTSPLIVDRLVRIKGVLWLSESSSSSSSSHHLESYRCVVHLSGRGRLGFELNGKWTSPPVSEMAFIGQHNFVASEIEPAFANCSSIHKEEEEITTTDTGCCNYEAWSILQQSPEFDHVVLLDDSCINDTNNGNDNHDNDNRLLFFRLTGSRVYGYSVEEMERDLRIDIDAMNMDLADAVNASIDRPKAFVVYTKARIKSDRNSSSSPTTCSDSAEERVVLCYPAGICEPANNWQVLLREARVVLQTHFRNVQVCKCGA